MTDFPLYHCSSLCLSFKLEEFVQATEERHNSLRMDSNEMKGELEKLVANKSPPAGDLDAKIEKLENMLLEKEHENENLKQHNIMLAQQMEAKIEERMKQVEAELEKKILALVTTFFCYRASKRKAYSPLRDPPR